MLFSSFSFLFVFLPVTVAAYFLPDLFLAFRRKKEAPLGYKNAVLLVASLFFYAWGEPLYVLLMLALVTADYWCGLRFARAAHPRALLAAAVSLHIALLFFYKYAGWLAGLFSLSFAAPRLPLGISFYTFQSLSYVADTAKGKVEPEKNLFRLTLYVAFFPQLIAGPIVTYREVATALSRRRTTLTGAAIGTRRFAAGLAKKMLLANPAGALFALLTARARLSALGALTALFAFSFQIYFDFSGYTDMALGLGRLFGFRFPENFRYPYLARGAADFWRRWHISLSSFFREYVYFPLGGSRRGTARTLCNLFIVWALTGLWHGAAWNFLLWGVYWFCLIAAERFILKKEIGHPLALVAVLFGWLIFAFDGSSAALSLSALPAFLGALFGKNGFLSRADGYDLVRYLPFLVLSALAATPLPRRLYRKIAYTKKGGFLRVALPLVALFFSVAALSGASFNPFLYFRF